MIYQKQKIPHPNWMKEQARKRIILLERELEKIKKKLEGLKKIIG